MLDPRPRAEYAAAGVKVIGISPDPVAKVKKFHDKRDLNFTLLADADHAVCDRYGVWVQKSMYGKTYMGAQRATFIIDAEGCIRHVIPKASPKTHDDEVLKVLGALGSGNWPSAAARIVNGYPPCHARRA